MSSFWSFIGRYRKPCWQRLAVFHVVHSPLCVSVLQPSAKQIPIAGWQPPSPRGTFQLSLLCIVFHQVMMTYLAAAKAKTSEGLLTPTSQSTSLGLLFSSWLMGLWWVQLIEGSCLSKAIWLSSFQITYNSPNPETTTCPSCAAGRTWGSACAAVWLPG